MYCMRCGNKLDEKTKFCSNCGLDLSQMVMDSKPAETVTVETPKANEYVQDSSKQKIDKLQKIIHNEKINPCKLNKRYDITIDRVIVGTIILLLAMSAILSLSENYNPDSDDGPVISFGYEVKVIQGNHIQSVSGGGTYNGGTVVLAAVPEDGYCFWGWYDTKGEIVSTNMVYTIKAQNITLKAVAGEGTRITLLKGAGIDTVEGDGYYSNSAPKIKATVLKGEKFKGWYDVGSGTIISKNASTTLSTDGTMIIVALTESTTYSGSERLEYTPSTKMTDTIWLVTDYWTGRYVNSAKNVSDLSIYVEPGRYYVQVIGYSNGTIKGEEDTILVDGIFHRDFEWKYNGRIYGMWWESDYSVIDNLHRKNIDRSPNNSTAKKEFVDYNSSSVEKICEILSKQSSNMSLADRANFVLAFVQQITAYELDKDYNGEREYFKYPTETLYDMRGDCEDTSILYCALMKKLGYEVAICDYVGEEYKDRGHMAAAVYVPSGIYGTYYDMDGKKFYYCETTSDTMKVGDNWDEYNRGTIIIIP